MGKRMDRSTLSRLGEEAPTRFADVFDMKMDDLEPYQDDYYVRYALCSSVRGETKTYVVRGCDDPIVRLPVVPGMGRDAYECVASQAAPKYRPFASREEPCKMTWEDGKLENNRNVCSVYEFDPEDEEESGTPLNPLFVRVSCRDALGRVFEDGENNWVRSSGFCVDEWAGIRRGGM